MADYKRVISYMYNYENQEKKNNIGYSRIETMGNQCKITIHMKVLSVGEKNLKAYIFYRDKGQIKGVLLGDLIIKNGVGEYRGITNVKNMMNSNHSFSEMGGIVVYASKDKYFGTEWDDRPILLTEMEEDSSKKTDQSFEVISDKGLEAASKAVAVSPDSQKEIVTEKQEVKPAENLREPGFLEVFEPVNEKESVEEPGIPEQQEVSRAEEVDGVAEAEAEPEGETVNEEVACGDSLIEVEEKIETEIKLETEKEREDELKGLNQWDFKEQQNNAEEIFSRYPKMYPFEDDEIVECVRIEPRDIGILPMDSWGLANNSFLLHGYYSYRHLIFAKRKMGNTYDYILGVPGVFHNREEFMARMFGFNNFKSIKGKLGKTGEFGYWYMNIII